MAAGSNRGGLLMRTFAVICCHLQESLCSLKFAAKVNGCETAAKGGAKRNVTQGAAALPALVSALFRRRCCGSLLLAGPVNAEQDVCTRVAMRVAMLAV